MEVLVFHTEHVSFSYDLWKEQISNESRLTLRKALGVSSCLILSINAEMWKTAEISVHSHSPLANDSQLFKGCLSSTKILSLVKRSLVKPSILYANILNHSTIFFLMRCFPTVVNGSLQSNFNLMHLIAHLVTCNIDRLMILISVISSRTSSCP